MANAAESMQAKIGALLGTVMGAVIAPSLGFAFGGYHSLSVYLDFEKKSAVLLAAIGAFIGMITGRIYGTCLEKCKTDGGNNGKRKSE